MTDGKQYAMKVFEPESSEKDRINQNTQNEFDKVSKLEISCIPRYYEFKTDVAWVRSSGETRQVSYLLMENCQGLELFDFVNEVEGI